MKKAVVFGLALVVPVLVYLFMQGFGDNKYALPVLYMESVPAIEGCPTPDAPYALSLDDIYTASSLNERKNVLFDVRRSNADTVYIKNELQRVINYFGDQPYHHAIVDLKQEPILRIDGYQKVLSKSFVECILRSTDNNSFLALVDARGRIRSYYESDQRSEFDRLITETEILLTFESNE